MTPTIDISGAMLVLGKAGIEVAVNPTDPDRLLFRPVTADPDLVEMLRRHQCGIIDLLAAGGVRDDDDAEYTQAERLGIGAELGMATHAGSPAWLVAVGEALRGMASRPPPAPPSKGPAAWAGILGGLLGVPVTVASVTPRGEKFPGELGVIRPNW